MCGIGLAITKNSYDHNLIADKINNEQSYRGPDFSKIKNYYNYSICHQRLSKTAHHCLQIVSIASRNTPQDVTKRMH